MTRYLYLPINWWIVNGVCYNDETRALQVWMTEGGDFIQCYKRIEDPCPPPDAL